MSNPNTDLEDVITASLEDAELSETPIIDDPSEVSDPDPVPDAPETPPEPTPDPTETNQVPSPGSKVTAPKTEPDDFEKRFGIAQNAASGRENRIPYSRVTKIVGKAVKEEASKIEASYTPKIAEFETKVKAYEERLGEVAKFEHLMLNDHEKFVELLKTVPGYKDLFDKIQAPAAPIQPTKEEVAAVDPASEMPGPDQTLKDGSKVYSMDGLKALLAWQQAQVEAKVTKQVSEKYAPIEKQYKEYEDRVKAQKQIDALIPKIQSQITEARTWNKFTENEEEITKALNSNRNLSLEGAYRQVVLPKLASELAAAQDATKVDRNKIRAEILAELKKAPTATASPTSHGKPSPDSGGAKTLEEIILEQVEKVPGR